MNVEAVLRRGRDLVRKGWCQGAQALDDVGVAVKPASREAVRFCAYGAIQSSQGNTDDWTLDCAVTTMRLLIECRDLRAWNDEHRKEEVVRLFDQAIERAAAGRHDR